MAKETKEEAGLALASPTDVASMLAEVNKPADDSALAAVTSVGDFLPYIALYGSNSGEVKRGEFPMGHFGLRKSKSLIVDLGEKFVAAVLAWRPKAMAYKPEVISVYDITDPLFIDIQKTAGEKDSNKGFGPEFLIWLPEIKEFATYFLGNPTGRNESPNILGPLKEKSPFVCIQQSDLIETAKYSWHGPVTKAYDIAIEYPPISEIKEQVMKFQDPPKSGKELAKDEDSRR